MEEELLTLQKTIEFEEYLDNDKDINELLQKIYNNIELQYKEDIINYLRTSNTIQTQYYPFNHHYKFYEHDNKLNETTFDYFKECVNDNYWIENLLEDGLEQGLVETFALAVEMLSKDKKFNEFKMCADDNWNFHDAFIDIVTMWVDDPYLDMVCNLENYFDVEEIVNNLRLNENYKDMFEKIDNKEIYIKVMEESILHTIPNNIIDLYPLTRKMQRHFVLHIGETNSGKTHDAIEALKKCDKGIYLAPLRLLAYEQYDKLNNEGYSCSLITGEERMIVDHAKYQSSTIEMLDILEEYDIAIIDEAQMLEDKFRGGFWTKAILGVRAHEIHICAAPQAEDILIKLISACHDTYEIVRHERNTQLIKETKSFGFPKSVQKGDALIVFSRKSVHGGC
ncbi:MAG: hypothetical protein LUG60_04865 [Erysipelotrichaceae bacterium]|nr:hypothetical protein [Erysipelotrichaceae bacterium]